MAGKIEELMHIARKRMTWQFIQNASREELEALLKVVQRRLDLKLYRKEK